MKGSRNAMTCFRPPKNLFKFDSRNFYIHRSVDRLISIAQRRPSFNLYAWPTPFDVATWREQKKRKNTPNSLWLRGEKSHVTAGFRHPYCHHPPTWQEFVYPASIARLTFVRLCSYPIFLVNKYSEIYYPAYLF